MFRIGFTVIFFLFMALLPCYAQDILQLNPTIENIDLTPYLHVADDATGELDLDAVSSEKFSGAYKPLQGGNINFASKVHWLRFRLQNKETYDETYNISITFTDHIHFYTFVDGKGHLIEKTGDLTAIYDRSRPLGKLVVMKFTVPAGQAKTYYARLESITNISEQFKPFALGAIRLYSETGYDRRFVQPRIYHALFYGAIIIMLLYNFFIFISLRDKSYLYYVFFIFSLLVFLAADGGFLVELAMPAQPRLDLYIRFISTPLLLLLYLFFSKSYLQVAKYLPGVNRLINGFMLCFGLVILLMLAGHWHLGRSLSIIGATISFVLILVSAIMTVRKGFYPAYYFLAANVLLLVGGVIFALQRFSVVAQNPITQYSIQISAVLQVALFSLGLADRINLVRKELAWKTLENERLERQKETDLKRVIEEKNIELEQKVLLRTAEVVEQKEEIEVQRESLLQYNHELEKAQELIKAQNDELTSTNSSLEVQVQDRTKRLKLSNVELKKAVEELDNFIYKTAHDIRGPLARLMGLCNVALIDVSDKKALEYFEKLNNNANHLNTILSRLSTIYQINNLELENMPISFSEIIKGILHENNQQAGFGSIAFKLEIEEDIDFQSDQFLVRLVLNNLIENAYKYYDPYKKGQSFISMFIKRVSEHVEISILDNGIGLNEAEIPHIFEMFSHAADVHQSPGLGLYMAKISVEKMQGTIKASRSKPNGHTHFHIRLPLAVPGVRKELQAL